MYCARQLCLVRVHLLIGTTKPVVSPWQAVVHSYPAVVPLAGRRPFISRSGHLNPLLGTSIPIPPSLQLLPTDLALPHPASHKLYFRLANHPSPPPKSLLVLWFHVQDWTDKKVTLIGFKPGRAPLSGKTDMTGRTSPGINSKSCDETCSIQMHHSLGTKFLWCTHQRMYTV